MFAQAEHEIVKLSRMSKKVFKNARMVNESQIIEGDLLISKDRIEKIGGIIEDSEAKEIDCKGFYLIPGIIDDQVHFRQPGLTHKADIATESKAAVAGGVTSFMEMPNTKPQTVTQERLEEKYIMASQVSPANYSFFMGATNENIEEVLKTDPNKVCGLKIFMGSSTGNMLVDNRQTLENIFSQTPMLIATHCEDEATVRANMELAKQKYGEEVPFEQHPIIRSHEACYLSSSLAVELAKKHNTRLHILHISTAKELELFNNTTPLKEKRITSEACVHHMYFNDSYYPTLGSKVKCNPAIKSEADRAAIVNATIDGTIDIIATDHAPHTMEEKSGNYFTAPSGLPLVQHAVIIMLDFYHKGVYSLEKMVEKMCHAPADCFRLSERGYLREGYFADIVLLDVEREHEIKKEQLYYKCGWSPLENMKFKGAVNSTYVNGELVYANSKVLPLLAGKRLEFSH